MLRKIFVTGALALSLGLGAGLSPAAAYTLGPDEADHPAINGERTLGVDISEVLLTATGVQGFLATLSPQGQQSVLAACLTAATSIGGAAKADARYVVDPFCDLATGGATMAPAAYAPASGFFPAPVAPTYAYPAAGQPG